MAFFGETSLPRVKRIQRGSFNWRSTDTLPISQEINAVDDLSKTILRFTYTDADDAPKHGSVRVWMPDASTVRATNNTGTGMGTQPTIYYEVLEFDGPIDVQHSGAWDTPANGDTETITRVDRNHAWIYMLGMDKDGNSFGTDDAGSVIIASETTVQCKTAGSPDTGTISYLVVTTPDCRVDAFTDSVSSTTATNRQITIPPVDIGRTEITLLTSEVPNNAGFDDQVWGCELVGIDTIDLTRNTGGSANFSHDGQIIRHGDYLRRIQRGYVSQTSGTTTTTETVQPFNPDYTFSCMFGMMNGFSLPANSLDQYQYTNSLWRVRPVPTAPESQIEVVRAAGASSASEGGWYIMEFRTEPDRQPDGVREAYIAATQATGAGDVPLTVTMTGTGALTLVTSVDWKKALTFSGTGALTLTTTVGTKFAPTFVGTGALSLVTSVDWKTTLTLTGSGSLTLVTSVDWKKALTFSGTGSLTLVTSVDWTQVLTFSGTGALTLVTSIGWKIAPTFSGTGALALVTSIDWKKALTFTGTGALSLVTSIDWKKALTFAGSGSLSLVYSVGGGDPTFAPTFTGTGALSLVTSVDWKKALTLSGTGALSLVASVDRPLALTFAGSGALSLVTAVDRSVSLTLSGTGSLALVASVDRPVALTMAGTGSLTLVTAVDRSVALTMAGTGSLSLVYSVESTGLTFAPTFAGSGALSLVTSVDWKTALTMAGTGSLTLVYSVTGGVVESTVARWGRYKVYNPDSLGEIAYRKLAWLRQRNR